MNKELDKLLCLLDGKITAYRMKNPYNGESLNELLQLQLKIQELWDINKRMWIKMIIIGLLSTREEAIEVQYISKIVTVSNRIKDIARSV